MAAVSIRGLDEEVRRRLRIRAARHGVSMEAEIRSILAEAVREPAESAGLMTAILDRFSAVGGVDLELSERSTSVRSADFDS